MDGLGVLEEPVGVLQLGVKSLREMEPGSRSEDDL